MRRIVAILSLSLVLGGCSLFSKLKDKDNVEPPAELVKFEAVLSPEKVWSRKIGHGTGKYNRGLVPVFLNETVFAADERGSVVAIDADNGKEIWSQSFKKRFSAGPGAGAGILALGTLDGEVLVLDAASGNQRWSARVSSEVLAAPAIADGIVVVRSQDGRVYGFSQKDGGRVWVYDATTPLLTLRGNSPPLVRAGTVLVGFDNGSVVALRISDGTVLWDKAVALPEGRSELDRLTDVDGEMAIVATDVYVVTHNGRAASMALESGRLLWVRDMSSYRGVSVDRTRLHLVDDDDTVFGMDRRNGSTLWQQDGLAHRTLTTPVGFDDYVVVADVQGYLHWMSAETGEFVAREKVDSAIIVTPLIARDKLIVYGAGGTLVAYRAGS